MATNMRKSVQGQTTRKPGPVGRIMQARPPAAPSRLAPKQGYSKKKTGVKP